MPPPAAPDLAEAARVWARIGLLSFGGPAGQIALMHRIIVEERRWLGERRFLHALNFCMLLPGPEAMQLSVYIGWLLNRTPGAIIAGVLFLLPGVVAIMGLSWAYAVYGQVGPVEALFFGLKAAVLAIVAQAVLRIGGRVLNSGALIGLAAASFGAIFLFGVPFPVIILAAGLIGYGAARSGLAAFGGATGPHTAGASRDDARQTVLGDDSPAHAQPDPGRAIRVSVVLLGLWLIPVALLYGFLGPENVFSRIAGFFSLLAVLSFGGAYAVLAWVAQEAVQNFGWLAPGEMLDGLGMAETTPGPLILVTQFVGFIAAFRDPGLLPPVLAGVLGGLLTVWVMFLPSFLWILLGGPYIERLRTNRPLAGALSAVTAAVVGVILNLALWFAFHTLFAEVRRVELPGARFDWPVLTTIDPYAAALSLGAVVAVFAFRAGTFTVIAGCALAGLALHLAGAI